jgi:hypothetical protein
MIDLFIFAISLYYCQVSTAPELRATIHVGSMFLLDRPIWSRDKNLAIYIELAWDSIGSAATIVNDLEQRSREETECNKTSK